VRDRREADTLPRSLPAAPDPLSAAAAPAQVADAADAADGLTPSGITVAEFLRLFTAVMFPMFLASVDQTLLATATPAIGREFGNLADTSWVAVGYLLAAAVMIPIYGRLGDAWGYRRVLLGALGAFAAGSLLGGFAPSLGWLVAARVLQGLGGGGLMVLSQALIGEVVPPRERPRFQGWFAVVFTLSSVVGPVVGGAVVHAFGWRWLFWGILPLVALSVWRIASLPERTGLTRHAHRIDALTVIMFAIAATLTLLLSSFAGQRFAWLSGTALGLASAALLMWWLVLRRERAHAAASLLPFDILALPGVRPMVTAVVVTAGSLFALVFFLPIYLQLAQGNSPLDAGLGLLPVTLGMALGGFVSGRVVGRTQVAGTLPKWGLTIAALGVAGLGVLPAHSITLLVLPALAGLGMGMVMPNAQIILQTVAGRGRLGSAAALVSLARSAGATLGTALFGAVVYGQLQLGQGGAEPVAAVLAAGPAMAAKLHHAFAWSYLGLAAVMAAGAAVAWRIPRIPLEQALRPPAGAR